MPKARNHQSSQFTKMLLLGDSGTGKTGSLISLIKAGYLLYILDFDNGIDVLVNYLRDEKPVPGSNLEPLDMLDYITITDKFTKVGDKAVAVNTNVWPRALQYLGRWTNKGETYKGLNAQGQPANLPLPPDKIWDEGVPADWGPNKILVIDSFTFLCNAAMRYILKLNGRPAGPVWESDWNESQKLVEDFLALLYDESFQTNVIVCAHVAINTTKEGVTTAFPNALGKKLGPKVGRYFNSMLEVRRTGDGANAVRTINTVPKGFLELKNPAPLRVKPSYPIATGLADYFKAVRGE